MNTGIKMLAGFDISETFGDCLILEERSSEVRSKRQWQMLSCKWIWGQRAQLGSKRGQKVEGAVMWENQVKQKGKWRVGNADVWEKITDEGKVLRRLLKFLKIPICNAVIMKEKDVGVAFIIHSISLFNFSSLPVEGSLVLSSQSLSPVGDRHLKNM